MSGTVHDARARRLPRPEAPPPYWEHARLTRSQRRLLGCQRRIGTFGTITVMTLGFSALSTLLVCAVVAGVLGVDVLTRWQYPVISFLTPLLLVPLSLYQVMTLLEVLARLSEDYRELAAVDQLTGAHNRRGLFEQADHLREPSQVAMADLDDFKSVNDRYGHDFGDRVLIAVARRLTALCGPDCVVARTGGDEFVMLLPAGRALPDCVDLRVGTVPVRISIGVVAYRASAGFDAALLAADAALYAVKRRTPDRPLPAEGTPA